MPATAGDFNGASVSSRSRSRARSQRLARPPDRYDAGRKRTALAGDRGRDVESRERPLLRNPQVDQGPDQPAIADGDALDEEDVAVVILDAPPELRPHGRSMSLIRSSVLVLSSAPIA